MVSDTAFYAAVGVLGGICGLLIIGFIVLSTYVSDLSKKIKQSKLDNNHTNNFNRGYDNSSFSLPRIHDDDDFLSNELPGPGKLAQRTNNIYAKSPGHDNASDKVSQRGLGHPPPPSKKQEDPWKMHQQLPRQPTHQRESNMHQNMEPQWPGQVRATRDPWSQPSGSRNPVASGRPYGKYDSQSSEGTYF